MNDLLKAVSNALKPFGYHVRRYKAPNILKIPALENSQNTDNIAALRKAVDKGNFQPNSNLDSMVVYLRTCIREGRNIDTTKRVTQATLEENTMRCLRSMVKSVNHAAQALPGKSISVVILDDRSDPAMQEKLQSVAAGFQCDWEMRQTNETGQGNSLHQQFMEGRTQNALVYFCEDDYLHEIDAIATCWRFYEEMAGKLGTHMVLYPQEHAVLYDDHYPSYLVIGAGRHWRTMRHATHTFITHGFVVRDYWKYFENTKFVGVKKKRKKGSEARTTNKLFRHIPGFSPLRPAAVHLQFENTLPPLYDWRRLWEENAG